jgi:ankyrin repeat protein
MALLASPELNINEVDLDGMTALHWAVRNNSKDIILALLSLPDININIVDNNMMTPLDFAIRNEIPEILELLTHFGSMQEHNQKNFSGNKNSKFQYIQMVKKFYQQGLHWALQKLKFLY